MATKTSPVKVTAIVFSAKGLKPKKKDKHSFCVIFGSGQNKFRTDIVEDLFDNPVFNTECEIPVDDVTQPLTFVVTEKNEKNVLGQVVVPLNELKTFRTNRSERAPLRVHKKCSHPQGELIFEAWISSGSISTMLPTMMEEQVHDSKLSVTSGLKKLRDKLSHSPMLSRKPGSSIKQHKRNNSDGLELPVKPNASVSCQDLSTLSVYSSGLVAEPNVRRFGAADSANNDADSLSSIDSASLSEAVVSLKPEVTGVSPKEGPVDGGTRLTIRGACLGRNKEDVIGLFVCGSNVLSTLEYVSSSKLICTTKAHRAGAGNVTIETQSGGRGVSLVQFTFLSPATTVPDSVDNVSEASSSLSRSSSRGDADMKREGSFKGSNEKETGSSALPSAKTSLKARSMFDLSLMPKLTTVAVRPEVTGVSPRDGPALSSTRLVIRGSNLGRSRADIVLVTVAGVDCTESVEFESSSRLTCIAGPTPGGAISQGDIIVETKSGGVGTSTVKFRFVESITDDTEWAAVPYDGSEVKSEVVPVVASVSSPAVAAEPMRSSISVPVPQRRAMSSSPTTINTTKQPPPVVEIQPMSRATVESVRKVTPGSPFRKAHAPMPPSPVTIETKDEVDAVKVKLNSQVVDSRVSADNELRSKVSELTKQLMETGDQVKHLQVENKMLKDENERIRLYMESLISRAIAVCPQILCVDSS